MGPKGIPGGNMDIDHPGHEFVKGQGPFFYRAIAILV